jgi:hypothetical protein
MLHLNQQNVSEAKERSMEKYFNSLDELANWASSNCIDVISIDVHKCLSVNGSVKYGISCNARATTEQKMLFGRFNSNKFSDPSLLDMEAEKIESKLRSHGFVVDRTTLPV